MQSRGYLVGFGILMVLVGMSVFMLQVLNPVGGGLVEYDDFSVYSGDAPSAHQRGPEGGAPSTYAVDGEDDGDAFLLTQLLDSASSQGDGGEDDGHGAGGAGSADGEGDQDAATDGPGGMILTFALPASDDEEQGHRDDGGLAGDAQGSPAVQGPADGNRLPGIQELVETWSDRIASVEERGVYIEISPAPLQLLLTPPEEEPEPDGAVTASAAPEPAQGEAGEPAGGAAGTQSSGSASQPPSRPYIITHVVQPQETLSTIARRYGVSVETIAAMNHLSDPNRIRVGDTLQIPSADGVMHVVRSGDSLWSISVHYGVSIDAIIQVNQIATPDSIRAGDIIFVPGVEAAKAYQVGEAVVDASGNLIRNFSWPVENTVTSGFGPRWGRMHNGIDIRAAVGTPVRAAAAGTVTFARTGDNGGYGHLVVIDHGHGVETRYAHNSQILVKEGERVERGQVIALSGATGNVTGPHLHFEIRHYGVPVDPLKYLR